MFRLIPPAGTPTPLPSVLAAAVRSLSGSGNGFVDQLREFTNAKYVFRASSGRACQTMILQSLMELGDSGRNEVVIPAYTCYTVPASVVRAGLKVRPVDIDPMTLDYKSDGLRSADLSRVLAINSSNLFGIVSNWRVIDEVAQLNGCYRIDDAAQSFGSTSASGVSGMLGDVGFFSLDRGKNLSTFSGGVIITNDDLIGARLMRLCDGLPAPGIITEAIMTAKIAVYSLMLRPWLYWLPASLPFLGLGETVYNDQFSVAGLSSIQSRLGESMFPRLQALNRHRMTTAHRIALALKESGKFVVPGFDADRPRIYLRLPVLAVDENHRGHVLARLRERGIAASRMYPDIIANIPDLKPHLVDADREFAGATEVVHRMFTLPTHAYVTSRDVDQMLDGLLN